MLTVDVWIEDQQIAAAVRSSLARYRGACRQMFAALACAQVGVATIQEDGRLRPNNDAAALSLALLTANPEITKVVGVRGNGLTYSLSVGKAPGYAMRQWFFECLYPTARSFVWDSARRQVWSRWTAMDPEFPKASRGWLVLQGARGVAEFRRVGIELPRATAKPELAERAIRLHWDKAIGPVTLTLKTLDRYTWLKWVEIRDDITPPGTLILNERDGRLRVNIPYEQVDEAAVKLGRVLRVHLDGQRLVLIGPDDVSDIIETADATTHLTTMRVRRELWEACRRSSGSPSQPWGNRRAWKRSQRHLYLATRTRERFVMDCNHAWSRRVTSRAVQWDCAAVTWTAPATSTLGEHTWPWSQFAQFLGYKLTERGRSLTI